MRTVSDWTTNALRMKDPTELKTRCTSTIASKMDIRSLIRSLRLNQAQLNCKSHGEGDQTPILLNDCQEDSRASRWILRFQFWHNVAIRNSILRLPIWPRRMRNLGFIGSGRSVGTPFFAS